RLRTRHLVDQVEIDIEEVRLTLGAAYDVLFPDLPSERSPHFCGPSGRIYLLGLASRIARLQYRNMDNSSGVGVLDKAALVLGALEAGPATLAGLVQVTGLA